MSRQDLLIFPATPGATAIPSAVLGSAAIAQPTVTAGGPLFTQFGFNCPPDVSSYNPSGETKAQINTRLTTDYGNFTEGKMFPGNIPSSYSSLVWPTYTTVTKAIICMGWTLGSIASGSQDTALTTFCRSIPAGKTMRLSRNEVDNEGLTTGQWASYVADMDHLYDLIGSMTGVSATVEVWDCFMQFSIESGAWSDTWTNPAKRHGLIWDVYWNNSGTDTSGATKTGRITTKMTHLGMTRWGVGETGDRRPVDSFTPAGNVGDGGEYATDSARATALTNRLNTLIGATPAPEFIDYFDVVGTTGDHRILTGSFTTPEPDPATHTALRNFMVASRGGT